MWHELLQVWFDCVRDWGYFGVFILMAMESSILPVPSEVVMPPAAFWAAQGKMSFAGVVIAGTAGSWFGSAVSYWVALLVGRPLVQRYGRFLLMPPHKVALAECWAADHGLKGVFLARLLPVVRHLISIPAGILRLRFLPFSAVTILGAGLWCWILAWWGERVLGEHPDVLESPDKVVALVSEKKWWFVGGVLVLGALFFIATRKKKRTGAELARD